MSDHELDDNWSKLAQVLDDYMAARAAGNEPDAQALVAENPDLAEDLRTCLASLKLVGVAAADHDVAGAAGDEPRPADVQTLGDYRLVREIGRGGMGVVYEAMHLTLSRRVALKVLPFAGALDPRQLARFKNEAQAAAQLEHPHIVEVHGIGCERGVHFYVMRFIEGQTLAEVIEAVRRMETGKGEEGKRGKGKRSKDPSAELPTPTRGASKAAERRIQESEVRSQEEEGGYSSAPRSALRAPRSDDLTAAFTPGPEIPSSPSPLFPSSAPPPPTVPIAGLSTSGGAGSLAAGGATGRAFFRAVAELGIAAAEALHHAHEHGIVHRDVKPANLMVDHRGKLWVTDFGLAQMESAASLTTPGDLLGTLRYMSPEQALAKRVAIDYRTDIYSLGATLYELATLEPVFAADDKQELLRQLAFEEPRSLRKVRRNVPGEIETIVLKALEKNPADRYQSAQELADDLRRYLDEEPIRARRPGIRLRSVKWARRHRAAVVAMSVVLVLSAVTGPLVAWREASLRALAEAHRQTAERAVEQKTAQRKLAEEARQRADEARQRAEEEKRIAVAVKSFLHALLRQADVDSRADTQWFGGLEERANLTVRELLDRAAGKLMPENIQARFPNLPRVQAEILLTIGDMYNAIGNFDQAVSLSTRATEILRTTLGDDHPDTLASRNNLALAHRHAGRLDLAISLLERTLKTRENLGEDDLGTLLTRRNLADSYVRAGKLDLAIPLLERTLTGCETTLGDDRLETLRVRNSLALAYQDAGKLDLAISLFERTLMARGEDDPSTFAFRNNLVVAYQEAGKLDLAIPLMERTLKSGRETFGEDDPTTLSMMNTMGAAYWRAGRLERSVPLFEESLELEQKKWGRNHPETLLTLANLGVNYRDAGRLREGIALLEQVVERAQNLSDGLPADLLFAARMLAETYTRPGLLAKAEATYNKALESARRVRGDEHIYTFTVKNELGLVYWYDGKYDQAERIFTELLAVQRVVLGDEHHDTLNVMDNLAKQYREQRKFEQALPLFEEALRGKRRALGDQHFDTLTTLHNLGKCHLAAGDPERALPLLRESLFGREKRHPDDWLTFYARITLGDCLLAQGKYDEAEPLLLSGWAGMVACEEKIPPIQKVKLEDALERLLHLYESLGNAEQAGRWRAELAQRRAAAIDDLANSYRALGQYAEALKLHEDTLALKKAKLGPEHPDTLLSMGGVAQSLAALDRGAEALPIVDECLRLAAGKVVDPGLVPGLMDVRLRHFAKCNDAAGCRATAEMWEGLKGPNADSLYNAACFRAVTAAVIRAGDQSESAATDAAAEADRAMKWLKQAVAAGFKDANHMKQDTDLEALRTREDFKQLIAELEAGGM